METGKLCWFDFGVKDEAKAMTFFKSVFSWEFEPMGKDYWMVKVGKDTIGGIRKESKTTFKPSQGFVSYFTVPSIKEGKGLITKGGGKLIGETIAIGGGEHGHFQLFNDLDGNVLSLWSMKP